MLRDVSVYGMAANPDHLQRLLAEEPFVQALARSLLADEADDVVQQAYLRAIERRPTVLLQPRAWLARIVRNLAADQRRRARRRAEREQVTAAPHVAVPSSSELLQGEERRLALVRAVDRLPTDQRIVVLLRYYDGLPPRRIAAQLGVPVHAVWNRLHTALQTLRTQLDAEHGDRRGWLLPLVPFATAPRSLPWRELAAPAAHNLLFGAIVMTTKAKIAAAFAGILAIALIFAAWPSPEVGGIASPQPVAAGSYPANDDVPAVPPATVTAGEPSRQAVAAQNTATATTGALLVRVRYADEPQAAEGLTVLASAPGADFRVGVHRAVTNADGDARFEDLPPGSLRVRTTLRASPTVATEIAAGATAECSLLLQDGITVTGIVVDATGLPVGGARIEWAMLGMGAIDADLIAMSAADGTFTARQCESFGLIGARAAGQAASRLHFVQAKPGGTERVRIELLANGGSVEGVVLGPAGEPVPDAVVRVGEGKTEAIMSTPQGAPPLPAQVRSDATGRFLAIGIPAGTQPLQVRTREHAPWSGACEVVAGSTVAQRIVLQAGVTCTGIVRGEDGEPVAGASVAVGQRGDFLLLSTRTDTHGAFALHGLPPAGFDVAASKERFGKARTRLAGQPGETVPCELRLSNGLALRGTVRSDAAAPIAGAEVRCEAEGDGPPWSWHAFTDKEGRFLVADCPTDRRLAVLVGKRAHVSQRRTGIDPRDGELAIVLPPDRGPKARVIGRLLRPDGSAAAGEDVEASSPQTASEPQRSAGAVVQPDGTFSLEMPPGQWQARVIVKGHPEVRLGPWDLAAGTVVELGTSQLTIGGTLVVRDGGATKLDYRVVDAREQFVCGLYTPTPPLRSELLAPGDYTVVGRGEGIAALALPFTIRPGQETELRVVPSPGVRQAVEFAVPAGAELPRNVGFHVYRGGKVLAYGSCSTAREGVLTGAMWLAPGDYTLETRTRNPSGTASFTVGTAEGPPLRITLR